MKIEVPIKTTNFEKMQWLFKMLEPIGLAGFKIEEDETTIIIHKLTCTLADLKELK
jgi:hypothetical protein